tara:strand:+ start:32263 stop:32667 length:405 start_codon:yes stop_codon:yes gene_type:complete
MATGLIASRPTKVGDVLKHEYAPATGYTRRKVVVTVPAEGLEIGAVLESTSVAGKYILVAVATTANANAVLIDTLANDDTTVGGDFEMTVLMAGPSQVADKSLSFATDVDTDVEKQAVYDALLANAGIQVLAQV